MKFIKIVEKLLIVLKIKKEKYYSQLILDIMMKYSYYNRFVHNCHLNVIRYQVNQIKTIILTIINQHQNILYIKTLITVYHIASQNQ